MAAVLAGSSCTNSELPTTTYPSPSALYTDAAPSRCATGTSDSVPRRRKGRRKRSWNQKERGKRNRGCTLRRCAIFRPRLFSCAHSKRINNCILTYTSWDTRRMVTLRGTPLVKGCCTNNWLTLGIPYGTLPTTAVWTTGIVEKSRQVLHARCNQQLRPVID